MITFKGSVADYNREWCDEAGPDEPERGMIDWQDRIYYCGNCGCPRSIDDTCTAEKCGQCGDDETYLAETPDVP